MGLCHKHGTLLVVDTVCTLVGEPFFTDAWNIDLVYSGAQKCIGCPRALANDLQRPRHGKGHVQKVKPDIFSFDVTRSEGSGIQRGQEALPPHPHQHHVRHEEALQIVSEEGLENSWNRHLSALPAVGGSGQARARAFREESRGQARHRELHRDPRGPRRRETIANAYDKFNLEISGGLGGTAGKVFRIGLMGYNCTPRNVESVVTAFEDGLKQQVLVNRNDQRVVRKKYNFTLMCSQASMSEDPNWRELHLARGEKEKNRERERKTTPNPNVITTDVLNNSIHA